MRDLLNAEQKNIDRISFIIDEASKMNIKLLPPSINESGEKFTVINDDAIRFGLAAIKNGNGPLPLFAICGCGRSRD